MRRHDREITEAAATDEILREADACSLALLDGDAPYVIALNYGHEWTPSGSLTLYFHCAKEGKKLELIRANPRAAFIAHARHQLTRGENACDWGMNYASVAGSGAMSFVTDPVEKKKGLDLLMDHYAGTREFPYDERVFAVTEVLKLEVLSFSAKQRA
jgi:nitroimidazol reductase NimA-like FMN-containing flavoprotein (pyridoxamine 5'-phosphate oxidase superfamily)